MSHWVVKVGLEAVGGEPSPATHDQIAERIAELHLEVQSVIAAGPRVLVVEPLPVANVEGLAERLAAWPGIAYARAVLRSDVEGSDRSA